MRQHDSDEDRMLIKKTKQGSRDAFEHIIRKYQKNIYFLCHRITGAHQSADDLSQETFVKAYFSLAGFDDSREFYPWLRKIAVNTTFNYIKSSKREIPVSNHGPIMAKAEETSVQNEPSYKIQEKEIQDKFSAAVNQLPPDQKIVFMLKVYEDQSYEDIASSLQIPTGTVMSRLSRARRKLKEALDAYMKGGVQ
jgi:RNA polymerase sigma-70 factor (ECF subfamily)